MVKTEDGDFLHSVAESVLQLIMKADAGACSTPAGTSDPATARPGVTTIATAISTPGPACST
jgi:hypothetical protein